MECILPVDVPGVEAIGSILLWNTEGAGFGTPLRGPFLDPFRKYTFISPTQDLLPHLFCRLKANMRFLTMILFFFALSLGLMPGDAVCVDMTQHSTFAVFGPSIKQISQVSKSETAFQAHKTTSITGSYFFPMINATNTEQAPTPTMSGTIVEQNSTSSSKSTIQQTKTAFGVYPSPIQFINASYTIEAIIQIQISDFIGTATVNLSRTDSSMVFSDIRTSTNSTTTTTTEDDIHHTLASRSTATPSQSNDSSSVFSPPSNWTAGCGTTNSSFINSLSPPSSTALTVFTGDGMLHRRISVSEMFLFIMFQIVILNLV